MNSFERNLIIIAIIIGVVGLFIAGKDQTPMFDNQPFNMEQSN